MKKVMTVLLLTIGCCSMYGQYIPGGIVSQGTLMSTRTEIVRSGFDVWAGAGVGVGGVGSSEEAVMTYHVDINAGYNVSPRLFVGVGLNSAKIATDVSAVYVNLRPYVSRELNSLYFNIFLGKVVSGNTTSVVEYDGLGRPMTRFFKPSGVMGGYTMGYVWDHFAFEAGMNICGGKLGNINISDYPEISFSEIVEEPSLVDWKKVHDPDISVLVDFSIRVSWRF